MVVDDRGHAYIGNYGFDIDAGAEATSTNLVCVDPDGDSWVVAEQLLFPNGMVIADGGRTLVVAESFGQRLSAYDLQDDGSLAQPRVWADLRPNVPDGICLDAAGGIWVADPINDGVIRVVQGAGPVEWIPTGRHAYACALGGDERPHALHLHGRVVGPDPDPRAVQRAHRSHPGRHRRPWLRSRVGAVGAHGPAPDLTDPPANATAAARPSDGPRHDGWLRRGGPVPASSTTRAERRKASSSARRRTTRAGRRLDTEGPQHLDLGRHADHGGVGGQQEQAGLLRAHRPGVDLGLEERRGPGDQRVEGGRQPGRGRRAETADLAQQPEQLGASTGQLEDGSDDRLHPVPSPAGAGQRHLQCLGQLARATVDGRVEQAASLDGK